MQGKTMLGLCAAAAAFAVPGTAQAQTYYVGQVIAIGTTYCPQGTVAADGSLIKIRDNEALFSLIGTTFGGDGNLNVALRDLRARIPVGVGQGGPDGMVELGEFGGTEQSKLAGVPGHGHSGTIVAATGGGSLSSPADAALAPASVGAFRKNDTPAVVMRPGTVRTDSTGGIDPIPTLSPVLAVQFCVVTAGLFPDLS
jgi:microcystin-dependent protein